MPSAPNPIPIQALAPDISRRVGLIVATLAALVAHRFLHDPEFKSLILPLWTYLKRTVRRFERLMTRVAANRLPTRPPRPHRPAPDRVRPTPLPAGHAWLIRALGYEAVACASQLEHLLNEPGVADLLAASPAAVRILRPLGRMLGLEALAPKRIRPKRSTPREAKPRAPIAPPPQDPTYRPSAKWPRAHWPRPSWPPAVPRSCAAHECTAPDPGRNLNPRQAAASSPAPAR
jgi:hypothetical protein